MDNHPAATVAVDPPQGTVESNSRVPALTLAIAVSVGIVCDRAWSLDWPVWLLAAAAVTVLAIRRSCLSQSPTLCVLLLWLCLGGARHHWVWSVRRADDVARFATGHPQPVELTGVLASAVQFQAAEDDPFTPSWMRVARSTCIIDSEQLLAGGDRVDVSGRVKLEVSGHLLHAHVGDRVSVVGRMRRPGEPGNPGGFNFRTYLRQQQIDCVLRVNHPDAVTVLPNRPRWAARLARVRHALREECLRILRREVSPDHVPLAASLLLGDRTEMTDELRTAFAESGTMHLLAISGLHVGILAALVFLVCRLLNTGPIGTAVTVLVVVWLYAFVTDHRPPVLRATVLVTIVFIGSSLARIVNGLNALSVSALVILLWSPTDLFDVGAQLSFLAVAAILWSARVHRQWLSAAPPDDPLRPEPGRIRQLLQPLLIKLRAGYLITAAIWLFTLPLIMARFHLVSPVGFFLNVVLIPFMGFMLASGFILLISGIILPFLAAVPGTVFNLSLGCLLWVAEGSASWRLGHIYVGGPPDWWLAVFYICLAIATRIVATPIPARRAWRALAAWTILGLAIGLLPQRRSGVTCTFLDVGHGCGILLECPDGSTLLYDAGTLGKGRRAQQIVQQALWARGLHKLDVVVISHADVDHFNGVAGLLETVRIDQILISRSFLDFDQGSVVAVCEAAARHHVDMRLIQAGDLLELHPEVGLRVLHPVEGIQAESDNENSIVLEVNYAGRSILLTGDLEGAGLNQLLDTPARDVDVMLSPHHGSRAANPPALADWGEPEFVVISTGDHGVADRIGEIFVEDCRVLSTAESGAVTVSVSSEGELEVREFRDERN